MSVRIAIRVHCWEDEPVEVVVQGCQVLSGIRETFIYYVIIVSSRVQHFVDEITTRSFIVLLKLIFNFKPIIAVETSQMRSTHERECRTP